MTLHIGALPVMAHAAEEVEEMVDYVGALVPNPGRLSSEWAVSMFLAGHRAGAQGVAVISALVGAEDVAGAARLRAVIDAALRRRRYEGESSR